MVASPETATCAPALKALPFVLEDSSREKAAERIIVVVNGATGVDNRSGRVSTARSPKEGARSMS